MHFTEAFREGLVLCQRFIEFEILSVQIWTLLDLTFFHFCVFCYNGNSLHAMDYFNFCVFCYIGDFLLSIEHSHTDTHTHVHVHSHTRACALKYARACAYILMNMCKCRHPYKLTLATTHSNWHVLTCTDMITRFHSNASVLTL